MDDSGQTRITAIAILPASHETF